ARATHLRRVRAWNGAEAEGSNRFLAQAIAIDRQVLVRVHHVTALAECRGLSVDHVTAIHRSDYLDALPGLVSHLDQIALPNCAEDVHSSPGGKGGQGRPVFVDNLHRIGSEVHRTFHRPSGADRATSENERDDEGGSHELSFCSG